MRPAGLWLEGDIIKRIPPGARGSYLLFIRLEEEAYINIGKMGEIGFRSGCYAYVGSAMIGLAPRIGRHLKRVKKKHWHIDYLLDRAEIAGALIYVDGERAECAIARGMAKRLPYIEGFGCSDCRCPSHLFYCKDYSNLKHAVNSVVSQLEGERTTPMIENSWRKGS